MLYFNADVLPGPNPRYVIWLDGMGAASALTSSMKRAANFIGRLQAAVDRCANHFGMPVFPVMDGAYITSASRLDVSGFVRDVMRSLGESFLAADQPEHRFMPRGGVAFGPAWHGADIPDTAFGDEGPPASFDSVLMSPAMPLALAAESSAPPFGIAVDDSAMTGPVVANPDDQGFSSPWLTWADEDSEVDLKLLAALREHLEWSSRLGGHIGYSPDRAAEHATRARQYFGDLWPD